MTEGDLLLIIGPPAVGKKTVGRAVCARSDYRLFHNHASIEPLLDVFDYGTAPFTTLNLEIRRRVIEEAAASGTRLVFTFVWAVDLAEDAEYVTDLVRPYLDGAGRIATVELYSGLETRLARNGTAERLAHERSKRDVAWSEGNLRDLERTHRMNTDPVRGSVADPVLARWPHLRLDNTHLTPEQAADQVLRWLASPCRPALPG